MSKAVVCESCERSIKVGDDLAGRKIKCPGCGKVLAVPDEEVDEAPPRKPRRPDREEATRSKRSDRKERGELEKGKTIFRTFKMGDLVFFLCMLFFSLTLCVAGIIGGWALLAGKVKKVLDVIGLVVLSPAALAAGVFATVWVGKGAWRHLSYYRNKERFIIGSDKLQWVLGEDELLGQVPYDNIEELCLKNLESPDGDPYQIIGLRFRHPKRRDTFIDDDFRRADWEKEDLDFAIWDVYDTPVKVFFKSLRKALAKARNEPE